MTRTRTARQFLAAAGMSTLALAGLSGAAGAETPVFEPGVEIAQPEPEPDLPPGPGDIAQPEDEPDLPPGPGDIAQPEDGPGEPPVDGPDDLTDLPDCTHGCDGEDVPDDLGDGDGGEGEQPEQPEQPGDEGDEPEADVEDKEATEATEVAGEQARGALPRTGAGLGVLAGLGSALVAGGAAIARRARR